MIRKLLCFFGWHEKERVSSEHFFDSARYLFGLLDFVQSGKRFEDFNKAPIWINQCKHCKRRL